MRERQRREGANASEVESSEAGGGQVDHAKKLAARERKIAGQAKQKLLSHVEKVSKATLLGANIFQQMVRGDAEEVLVKKLEPALAEKLGEKVLDKVLDKLKEGLVEVTEIGKDLADKSTVIFSAIRSNVTDKIKTRGELNAMHVADEVTSGLLEGQAIVEDQLKAKIQSIPQEKLAAIGRELFKLREAAKDDESDSEEHGKLADGMEDWFMTAELGMPAGDGVAAEDTAKQAYSAFREGVRETVMSAGEAATDVQKTLAHPGALDDKVADAEDAVLGPRQKAGIEKDKALRARVAATGGGK